MNQNLKNALIAIGILLFVITLGFIVYKQNEISNTQYAIETSFVKQKEIIDGITRSQAQYASKEDIENFARLNGLNLKAIQSDLDKLHAEVISINTISVKSIGQISSHIPSTSTGEINPNPLPVTCKDGLCPDADPFGYMTKQQLLSVEENFGKTKISIGQVGFSAWQDKPWSLQIKPREYLVSTVIGVDENQRQFAYNKFSVKIEDKLYEIPISSAEIKQVYPQPSFSFWNPRLFLGIDSGINIGSYKSEFTPGIHVGIMSYGVFKNSPDISLIQVGIGAGMISKKPQLIFTPVTYNIGKHIPLMNNLYVGPSVNLSTGGDLSIMIGLKAGL